MSQAIDLNTNVENETVSYCTFKIGKNFFGIPVLEVQEVIKWQPSTRIPLSQSQIRGLINLRGQIVTLIGLRQLFNMGEINESNSMNVVVKSNDSLFALIIDEINEVIDVEMSTFEKTPTTVNEGLRPFVKGIHKLPGQLLIVLNLQKVLDFN